MQESLVRPMRAQLPQIRARWEALLRAEPVNTPLAYPDALIHLIDWSLNEIFHELISVRRRSGRRISNTSHQRQECPCGRNPLLTYFSAGEQAMQEALVLAQSSSASLDPIERDASLYELNLVFRDIAHREIAAFCGVCQHRSDRTPLTSPSRLCHTHPTTSALASTNTGS